MPRLPATESNPTRLLVAGLGILAVLQFPRLDLAPSGRGRKILYALGFLYGARLLASMTNRSGEAVLRDTFTVTGLILALAALSAPRTVLRSYVRLRAVALAGSFAGVLAAGVWGHFIPVPF